LLKIESIAANESPQAARIALLPVQSYVMEMNDCKQSTGRP
jgi:hypothetical protein